MDGSKYRSKGYGMVGAGKRLPCVLLVVVLGAAVLSVVVLHKVREQRAVAVLLRERDRQVVSLRILLQKEKAFNKETKRKVEEMKATISSLRNQKTDLKTKYKGLEASLKEKDSRMNQMEEKATNLTNTQKELEASLKERDSRIKQMEEKATNLQKTRKELEASLKERDSRIKQMEEKATNLQKTRKELEASLKEKESRISLMEEKAIAGSNPDQMAALMEILQRKEAELEEIKTRFQDYRITDRKVVSSKSIPAETNNANATPDTAVALKVANSSNTTIPATSELKRSGNTTVTESKHQKQKARSLEEKQVKLTSNTVRDDLQDKRGDVVLDIDDIYGESHSKKSEPRRNKKFLIQGEELDGIGQSGHSQDQDSDRVRFNKPLVKENNKTDETKKKNSTDGHLEKIYKDILSDANLNRPKQALQEMAGATDVKPKMSVNDDGTLQQNKRQKKKKFRSKKKKITDTVTVDGDEVAKEREVEMTPNPESVSGHKRLTALQ